MMSLLTELCPFCNCHLQRCQPYGLEQIRVHPCPSVVKNSNATCPNRPSQTEFRKRVRYNCGMRNSECGLRDKSTRFPCGIGIAGQGRLLENNKSLPDLSAEQGQMGDGSSPLSLSRAGIGRHPRGGCQLPDAILHGKRSHRPRSRAVQRLAATGFRVRLFSSLGLVVAPPACEPGKDTPVIFSSRLHRLAPGQPPLLAARSPGATGLASSLSGCLLLTVQRHRF
jgi:hypothetical protein